MKRLSYLLLCLSMSGYAADMGVPVPRTIDIPYYATRTAHRAKTPTGTIRVRIAPSTTPNDIQNILRLEVGFGHLKFGMLPIDGMEHQSFRDILKQYGFDNFQELANFFFFLGAPLKSGHETDLSPLPQGRPDKKPASHM